MILHGSECEIITFFLIGRPSDENERGIQGTSREKIRSSYEDSRIIMYFQLCISFPSEAVHIVNDIFCLFV